MLIGLLGRARSGKGTVANYAEEKYMFKKTSFADPLKQMLIKAGMCTYEECYVEKTELSRWLLQKIGTDVFRNQIDKEYWVKKMAILLKDSKEDDIIIEDVRMPNEAEMIKALGGVTIKLMRFDKVDGKEIEYIDKTITEPHESEELISTIPTDFDIQAPTGSLDGIRECFDEVINQTYTTGGKVC